MAQKKTTDEAPADSVKKKKSKTREYIEALLTAGLIAFFLRSFVVEAFKIPSGSMIPTLMVGDHIFVNKFIYGIRVPFTRKWLWKYKNPERGEPIVFIYPKDPSMDYIKRVVGLPGDIIRLEGDDVFVNGQKVENVPISVKGPDAKDPDQIDLEPMEAFGKADPFKQIPRFENWDYYQFFVEKLGDHIHLKQEAPGQSERLREWTVPPDHLFVMGDNRDNSQDSRWWGFVPIENVKGRAMIIWLSLRYKQDDPKFGWVGWTHFFHGFRWERFGKLIE